ncbi:MAG: Stealth CR1 domain-containing protein [Paracoccaceae bacterium]|nr:Stealth CR1 domain-containing protein [Paracoccaceae bacterium]
MNTLKKNLEPIDAVITWVNGNSQEHRNKRHDHMANVELPLHQNAVNPHRWICNDEILYCLQSIHNYAPWTRKIWIVVDEAVPDLASLPAALTAKVHFAFHNDIFAGFEDALPTFNSLAIESLIWRIEGLSECFMYFNDDVFLTSPLESSDVFRDTFPVLRGKWVDYSALADNPENQEDPAKFNHFMQINAANIMGFDASRLFRAAHVVHPLKRSKMARLFEQHKRAFERNIKHRFRNLDQFLPQGLHNHACIVDHEAILHEVRDHLHIKSGHGKGCSVTETRALLSRAQNSEVKFICVNDLPQLEQVMPDARDWLGRVVGGFSDVQVSDVQ